MASAAVIRPLPSSFVYEHLIAQVKAIQQLATGIDTALRDRLKSEANKRDGLKFRTFTFVDPYGNKMIHEHMDQELIADVLRKYKKDYVPKYLQKWIKIGIQGQTTISPVHECDLRLNLREFTHGTEFIAYGDLTVWLGRYGETVPTTLSLQVSVMDTIEKIKTQMEERRRPGAIELKSRILDGSNEPTENDWKEGKELRPEETLMSLRLYQENCVVLAKMTGETVSFLVFHGKTYFSNLFKGYEQKLWLLHLCTNSQWKLYWTCGRSGNAGGHGEDYHPG